MLPPPPDGLVTPACGVAALVAAGSIEISSPDGVPCGLGLSDPLAETVGACEANNRPTINMNNVKTTSWERFMTRILLNANTDKFIRGRYFGGASRSALSPGSETLAAVEGKPCADQEYHREAEQRCPPNQEFATLRWVGHTEYRWRW